MRLLLDTHTLLWLAHEPKKLSRKAMTAIEDGANELFVSAVSAIEIATKARKNRLDYVSNLARQFAAEVTAQGFTIISVDCHHAQQAGLYSAGNQDPWDRLLAAQAQIEELILLSCDSDMSEFNVELLW